VELTVEAESLPLNQKITAEPYCRNPLLQLWLPAFSYPDRSEAIKTLEYQIHVHH
jgi:hypothetical protein